MMTNTAQFALRRSTLTVRQLSKSFTPMPASASLLTTSPKLSQHFSQDARGLNSSRFPLKQPRRESNGYAGRRNCSSLPLELRLSLDCAWEIWEESSICFKYCMPYSVPLYDGKPKRNQRSDRLWLYREPKSNAVEGIHEYLVEWYSWNGLYSTKLCSERERHRSWINNKKHLPDGPGNSDDSRTNILYSQSAWWYRV